MALAKMKLVNVIGMLRELDDDAPAVPVQVLAFTVIVSQEVRRIKSCLCFKPVHGYLRTVLPYGNS